MLKQIAGRSGRRNSEYAEGLATTLRNPDVTTLRKALEAPPSALKTPSAGLFPEFEHLEVHRAGSFRALCSSFRCLRAQFIRYSDVRGHRLCGPILCLACLFERRQLEERALAWS